MKQTILTKAKIKPRLLHYLRQVERMRRSFVIADRGRPVARLVPYRPNSQDLLARLAGSVLAYHDPCAPVGLEDWTLA